MMRRRNPSSQSHRDKIALNIQTLVMIGEKERVRIGEPRSLTDLAEKYGEPVEKFYEWAALTEKSNNLIPEAVREEVERTEVESKKEDKVEGDIEVEKKVRKYLMKACERGNAQACATLLRLMGKLVEKQEVRIGLTADEIARRNRIADLELAEFERGEARPGVAKVSTELSLLPKNIRQGKGRTKRHRLI